ncbi:TetR/AcrR family transcriptional regulator [Nitratireductor sp. ZSWI3]|uniref:TetR/AcrR family transcriptional regulator n=1 Tax=Nitratireductor sp. ZSWI3 TaxID=2966359 RepID=UPI00215053A4|nr:TetR/AcrR family transcriptional regulator [Nitratireductor sp. ZSWI3]MCR4268105.1 TetR/AcrR family transcriptional regulator [Nitratireductor sp. ZSWI3]
MLSSAQEREGRRPGRPRDPQMDAAILDAALRLFVADGLEGASFERIAREAGVTRATIYRRWNARERLLADALGRLKENAEREFGAWQEMPFETLIGLMVDYGPKAWVDLDAARLLARVIGSAPDAPELLRVYWDVYIEPRRTAFNMMLERAREEGKLPPQTDVDMFQDMFSGAMMYELLMKPGEKSEDALRAYFIRLLQQLGLGPVLDRRKDTGTLPDDTD